MWNIILMTKNERELIFVIEIRPNYDCQRPQSCQILAVIWSRFNWTVVGLRLELGRIAVASGRGAGSHDWVGFQPQSDRNLSLIRPNSEFDRRCPSCQARIRSRSDRNPMKTRSWSGQSQSPTGSRPQSIWTSLPQLDWIPTELRVRLNCDQNSIDFDHNSIGFQSQSGEVWPEGR